MRKNDGQTSKYNNHQEGHNHWTFQCNAGGSCHLRAGAVSLDWGGGRYRPVKTVALSILPSTPDTSFRLEELIGDMPLSQSFCGVDKNLTIDGHN